MLGVPCPFHEQAEQIGTFLAEDRARDARHGKPETKPAGPSENTD